MIGEPFYRPLLQGCPDVPKYPELPFPHSPVGREALLHGHSSREYPPDGLYCSGERIFTALCPVDGESLRSWPKPRLKCRHSPEVKSCLQSASRIPLPEPTPPLESGNKEATLIGWGTAVPGVRSPFKATVIPLVRDSHPLFS